MLYPEDVWRRSFPNFVGNTWIGDLMVLYVVDEQHAYWYIRDDMLDRWKIGRDELHDLALVNLDATSNGSTWNTSWPAKRAAAAA